MRHRLTIGSAIVVSGLALVALQVLQYRYFPATRGELLFNTVPFVLVSLAIVYTGVRITSREIYDEHASLIAAWGVGGAVGFAAVFTLISFSITGLPGRALLFGSIDAGSAGGLAGIVVGVYDMRNRRTLATVETFAEKLKGLNRYGKVLNQSTEVHAVSSLCIEVADIVLNSDGAAFLIRRDGSYEIIDATLMGEDMQAMLREASESFPADEPLSAVTDGEQFDRLRNNDPGTTLGIKIPAGDTTAVLYSVYDDVGEIDAKDIEMFELLAAHASTALLSIDAERDPQSPAGSS